MTRRRSHRVRAAALPWLGAALLWFGLIAPMQADQEDRLARQGRMRLDRMTTEQALRQTQALSARVREALASACRAPSDPAAIRQRTVAATAGLALSPFSLSVSGGTGAGALVEAGGTYRVVAELLRRLGAPSRGGFLRSASLRANGVRWSVSAGVGPLQTFPRALTPSPDPCPSESDPGPETSSGAARVSVRPRTARKSSLPATAAASTPNVANPASTPEPPFTLVAFLTTEGRSRVSVAIRGEVRVVSVGDQVEAWTCVSIDRDEGAVFTSLSRGRLILKADP